MTLRIKHRQLLSIITAISLGFFVNCGSTATSSDAAADDPAEEDPASDTLQVTVTGQVVVRAGDVAASLAAPSLTKGLSKVIKPKFATIGDTVLTDATITLVKITADGTEEEITTTTTDAEGNYTLAQVDVCQAGTGAEDDYYYELRVTSGDTTVRAPLCPTAETETVTADVSPETTIAADIIAEVADVRSSDTNPIPPANEFTEVTDLVANNISDLEGSIEIPTLTDAEGIIELANGIATTGGDAEISYKAYQFESEFTGLTTSEDTTTEDLTGYIVRVTREACDQPTTTPILEAAAEALAEAMDAGTTFTPTDVVDAFNAASDAPTAETADVVATYADLLDSIESVDTLVDAEALMKKAELLTDDSLLAAFTQHDLVAADLSETTELTVDQALTMLLSIPDTPCDFAGGFDLTDAIASLTGSASLEEPVISEVEIYSNSGFGCNDGDGDGHFVANVEVYIPESNLATVTGVVITSTDPTALGGDGSATLVAAGNTWQSNDNAVCVTQDLEVTYTVTATLSDASTVTKEVTRNHPDTPEVQLTQSGASLSGNENAPTPLDVAQPTFTWTSPDEILAGIAAAPAGSQIKYQIEFAHYRVGEGAPLGNTIACPQTSFGPWYETDNFIPSVACNIADCAAAQAVAEDQIMCRVSLQTYLLDETDDKLAQGAGNFKFFCVDSNEDGDCGE